MNLPSIIGISGNAQCGKDTFFKIAHGILKEQDTRAMRMAFADAVKQDCHQLLVKRSGISAFTDDVIQKQLIRPLLVAYGTDLMRKLDEDYWINRLKLSIELSRHMKAISFITDVRYENEADWIHNDEEGLTIHIHKVGNKPANKEEKEQESVLKDKADVSLTWKHVGEDNQNSLKRKVKFALKKLETICEEKKLCKTS